MLWWRLLQWLRRHNGKKMSVSDEFVVWDSVHHRRFPTPAALFTTGRFPTPTTLFTTSPFATLGLFPLHMLRIEWDFSCRVSARRGESPEVSQVISAWSVVAGGGRHECSFRCRYGFTLDLWISLLNRKSFSPLFLSPIAWQITFPLFSVCVFVSAQLWHIAMNFTDVVVQGQRERIKGD